MPDDAKTSALNYLKEAMSGCAPEELPPAALVAESPLDGEGPCAVFAFSASPGGNERQPFWVVGGRTQPNYYPAWNLSAEEIFRVHVGTRFMLVVGISQAASDDFDPAPQVRTLAEQAAAGRPVSDIAVAATFAVGEERHAVCRCMVAGEPVYVLARDCPPGFYRRTDLPPHVIYRMHLGELLLREAEHDRRESRRAVNPATHHARIDPADTPHIAPVDDSAASPPPRSARDTR